MFKVLFVLIVIAVIIAVIVLVIRGRRRTKKQLPPPPQDPFGPANMTAGDPRGLKAGDMVEYLGTRYFVRGSVRMREGGYTWSEHFIDGDEPDGTDVRRWLSVEEDPDLQVVMWRRLDDNTLTPSSATLTVNGTEYHRKEDGTATYTSEGTTGLGNGGRVEYADYESATAKSGDRFLSFERYNGASWETALGEPIPNGTLTVYPGS